MLHEGLSRSILAYSLILGLWALWKGLRHNGLDGSYWGAVLIGELLMIAQGIIGVTMALQGASPERGWVHFLYGVLSIIVWPGAYAFMYRKDAPEIEPHRQAILFGIIGLFLAGVAIRAMTTA
jgi:heme A synthase